MGLYDDQIKSRIRADDDAFSDAFAKMAESVIGHRLAKTLSDEAALAKDAVEAVLKFYRVKMPEIPDNITNINDALDHVSRLTGVMRRPVVLGQDWYKDALGAFVAVKKDSGAAVALLPAKLSGYYFIDPETGARVKLNKTTAALLDEEAICFYKPLPMTELSIKDLVTFSFGSLSGPDKLRYALLSVIITAIGFITPIINRMIYSHVVVSESVQLLLSVFGFLLCVTISHTMFDAAKALALDRVKVRLESSVQAATMMRMLSLPTNFYREYGSGEIANRASGITSLCTSILDTVMSSGLTSLMSLTYIFQMSAFGPKLVVPGLIVIIASVSFSAVSMLIQMKLQKRMMLNAAKESGLSYSLISGVQKIKLAGAEKRSFAKWAEQYAKHTKDVYDPPAFVKFSSVISTVISLVGTLVIYFFTIKSGVSLSDYYAFNSSYGMVMGAFSSLIGMTTVFAQIKPVYELVKPILETKPETSEGKKPVSRLSGSIELNNVSFRYAPDMPYVVDNMSLKIRAGQYIAIVGKTGCGKSTLMRLLLGFEKPEKGAVFYDGKDLRSMDVKSVRQRIGTVIQNGKLFSGDIYSNIVISAPQLTQEQAWEAAELAGIADDIRAMPMGMNTLISEGSGGVSGGQRQRLLIARAIAPKPKILMFDEATSALDNITQKKVSEALDSLKCTRIVIAHRLSTIKHCDRILVLDGGRIVEDGTFDELIAAKGFFAELVERQRVDAAD